MLALVVVACASDKEHFVADIARLAAKVSVLGPKWSYEAMIA